MQQLLKDGGLYMRLNAFLFWTDISVDGDTNIVNRCNKLKIHYGSYKIYGMVYSKSMNHDTMVLWGIG
jgi:hypothetical protein